MDQSANAVIAPSRNIKYTKSELLYLKLKLSISDWAEAWPLKELRSTSWSRSSCRKKDSYHKETHAVDAMKVTPS